MSPIALDLDESSQLIILLGDIDDLRENRHLWLRLQIYGIDFVGSKRATMSYSSHGEMIEILKDLPAIFEEHGQRISTSPAADSFCQEHKRSEDNFLKFAGEALKIRNGEIKTSKLQSFTNAIQQQFVKKNILYKLQLLSAYHMAFAQNACNFSVPGAGKTRVVYGAFAYLKSLGASHEKHVDKLLVISPLAAFAPWIKEYEACFGYAPSHKELVGRNADERKQYFQSISKPEITLISYQSASFSAEDMATYLRSTDDKVMVVLDEAHRIKNRQGRWAQAILSWAKYAKSRIVLTGTPIPNDYVDMINLLEFIWPEKDIINVGEGRLRYLSQNRETPIAKEEIYELTTRVKPFFIRVKKKDLGIPEPKSHNVMVDLPDNQRAIYAFIEDKSIDAVRANIRRGRPLLGKNKLMRLRQAATNIGLIEKMLRSDAEDAGARLVLKALDRINKNNEIPAKYEKCLELLHKLQSQPGKEGKAIIWSHYVSNIKQMSKFLLVNGIDNEMLYGATPIDNSDNYANIKSRNEIIDAFHHDDCSYKVIIANPQAVGESISLHKACLNAIYLDRDFNAASFIQSKDRIHRYGLKRKDQVNYYFLMCADTVDETIAARLKKKEERLLELIDKEDIPLLCLYDSEEEERDDDVKAFLDDYDRKRS